MRESFKVNEQEYSVLSKLKRVQQKLQAKEQLTDEEYQFLLGSEAPTFKSAKLRETDLNKENTEYQRKVQLRRNKMQIEQMKREKDFKEEQIHKLELVEFHEGFVSKQKPVYFLQNEIATIDEKILELEEQNDNIEKEMVK